MENTENTKMENSKMEVEKLINEFLTNEQETRAKRERSGKINPSSLGRCFRYQFWNRKNEPISNPPDNRTLRVFKMGNLVEEFVSFCLPYHDKQVKVDKDDVFGYADIVTEDMVLDIKSQHSRAFWYMAKKGFDWEEKKPNILQCGCYALLLGKPKYALTFVSKDDLCIKQVEFETAKWKDTIEQELKTLRDIWAKQELPPALPRAYYDKKKKCFKECGYCVYKDKCLDKGGSNC